MQEVLESLFDLRISEYVLPQDEKIYTNLSLVIVKEMTPRNESDDESDNESDDNQDNRKIKRWRTISTYANDDGQVDEIKSLETRPSSVCIDECEEDKAQNIIRKMTRNLKSTTYIFSNIAQVQIPREKQPTYKKAFKFAKTLPSDFAHGTCFRIFKTPVVVQGILAQIELKVKKYEDRLFGTLSQDTEGNKAYVFSKYGKALH